MRQTRQERQKNSTITPRRLSLLLAGGDPKIRIELSDATLVTSRFDARSAASAKVATVGPDSPKTGWTERLGVTPDDLLNVAKDLLKKLKEPKP